MITDLLNNAVQIAQLIKGSEQKQMMRLIRKRSRLIKKYRRWVVRGRISESDADALINALNGITDESNV